MKTAITAFILALLFGFNSYAADSFRFGFCDNTKNLDDKMIQLGGAMSVEAAAHFTAADLERFSSDGTIEGINVGLSTKYNIASIRAWLRDALTGENIATAELTSDSHPALADGWNAVIFASPVKIEPGKDYYAGYTMTLSRTSSIALVSVQTGNHDGACWLKVGDGEWTDRSADLGILNLELLIMSDNLPQTDLELTKAAFTDDYLVPGEGVGIEYSIHNVGMNPVSEYKITLSDEKAGISVSRTIECSLPHDARETRTETFAIDDLMPEHSYNFIFTVSGPDGKEDENPADNVVELPEIAAVNSTFERTVLIEEFTTERCSNCPAAAKNLKTMYDTLSDNEKKHTAIVCHHSGFYTDRFTKPCDESYLYFYGTSGRTFAPAFMFDRVKQSERALPVIGPQSSAGLKSYFAQQRAREAFYSIEVSGRLDRSSRTVELDIRGKAAAQIFTDPRITVYLTEDDVPAISQNNGGVDYRHNHLIRAYNSTWGVKPEWSDSFNYTSSARLEYPEECNVDNMEIVAVISNYDADDCNNCEVGNAFKVRLAELKENGVENVCGETGVRFYVADSRIVASAACGSIEVYDLGGCRHANENLAAGTYIVRLVTAAGTTFGKVIVK